jgi:predicted PurR-regulated permease PerM
MGLFRRTPPRPPAGAIVEEMVEKPPLGMWADGFGRLATRSLQALIVLGIATLLFIGLRSVTVVTIPVLLALIFASAFAPAMRWMRRRGVPSALASVITLLAIVLILGGVGWLIVWAVRGQWDELYAQGEEGFQTLLAWVQGLPFAPTDEQLEAARTAIVDFVTSAQFGSGALAGVSAIGNLLAGFVLLVTVLYFFLKDGPRMWEFLLRPFEGEQYARGKRIGERTVSTFGSYLRGTALVALVDAVGIGIGLLILQVPLALPLVVLTFVLSFIPIVGAVVAGAIAALVALVALGPVQALIVVGIVVLVQQLESNILQPFLMGRTMRLNAFVVLIALAAGTVLGGILGAVLAVPLTAAAWGIVQVWNGPDTPARWAQRKRPEGDNRETLPDRVAQRSIDRPRMERAARPQDA